MFIGSIEKFCRAWRLGIKMRRIEGLNNGTVNGIDGVTRSSENYHAILCMGAAHLAECMHVAYLQAANPALV